MAALTMKELLEAGVHFGHQTKRWNPKMQKYIFGERNGIYIIDLQKTLKKFREAYAFVRDLAAGGGTMLFIGTKKQAQETVFEEAGRCGMYYVNQRWLGGTLTNFTTIRKSIARLKKLEEMKETGEFERVPKKEALELDREREKLEKALIGIKAMDSLPSVGVHHRPPQGEHRGGRGPAARHPHRRHRRHELRSDRHRLSDPRQRRRHPGGAPDHLAHGRRHPEGRGTLAKDEGEAEAEVAEGGRDGRAAPRRRCPDGG